MAEGTEELIGSGGVTERLYYNDSFLKEFDAQVIACEADGARWRVRLDRTAFYPTSGGQPFDMGRLGDAAVVDVMDGEGDEIIHVLEKPVAIGPAHGTIDWERRFDHMQQHTAQHMLSAAFIELFEMQTVSFHLGREISTIDLAARSLSAEQAGKAEDRVNKIIFEDRRIAVRYATAEELAAQGVRKKVEREGILRVIEIGNFDRQPCGGTHLGRTGQAGMLLIRKLEKQKQYWRVEFVAGFRALNAARGDLATLRQSAELIGCGMAELPTVLKKMQEERRGSQREMKKLTERLAELEATELLARKAETSRDGKRKVVTWISDDATAAYLALIGAKLTAHSGVQAILASNGSKAIVLAQFPSLDADLGAMLRELLAKWGGKGGGGKNFAQGSIAEAGKIAEVVEAARDRLIG